MRDDFTQETKDILANRVGWKCSNPMCRKGTRGARTEEDKFVNIGVAAHICAASEGGPRYDAEMTSTERKSVGNGIWLCQSCSKLIDSDVNKYTVELLKAWKDKAEILAAEELECQNRYGDTKVQSLIVNSFLYLDKSQKEDSDIVIDVFDYFDGRFLKTGYNWDFVVKSIKDNVHSLKRNNCKYLVNFSTHFSIAFILGRLMNPKTGINAVPVQKTVNGSEIWDIKSQNCNEYKKLSLREKSLSNDKYEVAFVISITRNMEQYVEEYIIEEQLQIAKIYYCSFDITSIDSIIDGTHAWEISKQISHWIEGACSKEGFLHLFISCPVTLAFNLGKMSLSYGKGRIYDYDFEKRKIGTYFPALDFWEEDWI